MNLELINKSLRNRGVIATLAVASLVFGHAGPAAADEIVGAGTSVGWEYPGVVTPGGPLSAACAAPPFGNPAVADVDGTTFEITDSGTYSGVDNTNSPVSYLGDTTVTVVAGPHIISPLGTHDPGSTTDPLGTCIPPAPIPITATVMGTAIVNGVTGTVSCPNNSGSYIRAQSVAVIEFTGQCTVQGNVLPGTASAQVQHVLDGTMTPCTITLLLTDVPNPACDAAAALFPPRLTPPGSFWSGTYEAESLP